MTGWDERRTLQLMTYHSNAIGLSEQMSARKARDKLLALLEMMQVDHSPLSIAVALENLLLDASLEVFRKNDEDWAKNFIPEIAYAFFRLEQDLETGLDEAKERNRSGSTTTPLH